MLMYKGQYYLTIGVALFGLVGGFAFPNAIAELWGLIIVFWLVGMFLIKQSIEKGDQNKIKKKESQDLVDVHKLSDLAEKYQKRGWSSEGATREAKAELSRLKKK